jgi:hypothetical protein
MLTLYAAFGRTAPNIAIDGLRAIHSFDSANSVGSCAVFLPGQSFVDEELRRIFSDLT